MGSENSGEVLGFNLWGEPVYRDRRTKGRPPFEWTEENSKKVSMLLAMGWGNERIAGVVLDPRTGKSISVPTLKRHFRAELTVRDQARDLLRSRQLTAAAKMAFEGKGNVGAMRLFEQLVAKNDMMLAAERLARAGKEPEKDAAPAAAGKKETARRKARDMVSGRVSGPWGDDLKPGYRN